MPTNLDLDALEHKLIADLARINRDLEDVRRLKKDYAGNPQQPSLPLSSPMGEPYRGKKLSAAMMDALSRAYPDYLYPRDVKKALLQGGFAPSGKNFANVLRSTLFNNVKKGTIEAISGDGGQRYRVKR